jgi:hypothetical protein
MIPFDIDEAKRGANVVTEDGKPVRIICYDAQLVTDKEPKIIVLVNHGGFETILTFNRDGTMDNHETLKLMMSTERTYIGICFDTGIDLDIPLFETLEDAKDFISDFDRPVSHFVEFKTDTSFRIW